jgi:hypothetical protein
MRKCVDPHREGLGPAPDRLRRTPVGVLDDHERAAAEARIKYDHSLMHNDFTPYYVRVGDT